MVSRLSRSFKIVGTDANRSIMISYLNVPQQPWAYIAPLQRLTAISVEKCKFSYPRLLYASLKGIGYRRSRLKTRMMGLRGRERSLTIPSGVRIQCMNMTVRERRTDTERQQRPRLRVRSRGKKTNPYRNDRQNLQQKNSSRQRRQSENLYPAEIFSRTASNGEKFRKSKIRERWDPVPLRWVWLIMKLHMVTHMGRGLLLGDRH